MAENTKTAQGAISSVREIGLGRLSGTSVPAKTRGWPQAILVAEPQFYSYYTICLVFVNGSCAIYSMPGQRLPSAESLS